MLATVRGELVRSKKTQHKKTLHIHFRQEFEGVREGCQLSRKYRYLGEPEEINKANTFEFPTPLPTFT